MGYRGHVISSVTKEKEASLAGLNVCAPSLCVCVCRVSPCVSPRVCPRHGMVLAAASRQHHGSEILVSIGNSLHNSLMPSPELLDVLMERR